MDEAALAELTDSVRARGVLQPILVCRNPGGGYIVIAGHRRFAAARRAGLAVIPARLVVAETRELLELALIENLQRESLNPIEEAQAFQELMNNMDYTQEEVAKAVGKGRSTIANALRLLALPEPVRDALIEGLIDSGHARALLSIPDAREQMAALDRILSGGLTVREAEDLVRDKKPKRAGGTTAKSKVPHIPDPHFREMERQLRARFGTKVTILPPRGGKGKVEIEYYADSDLARILAVAGVRNEEF